MSMHPEFERAVREMTGQYGPILGYQRASLGAARFARFTEGHGKVQAMSLFLVMAVMTVPQAGWSDDALEALRQDADDLRRAADELATECEQLADWWQAQRQEAG